MNHSITEGFDPRSSTVNEGFALRITRSPSDSTPEPLCLLLAVPSHAPVAAWGGDSPSPHPCACLAPALLSRFAPCGAAVQVRPDEGRQQ